MMGSLLHGMYTTLQGGDEHVNAYEWRDELYIPGRHSETRIWKKRVGMGEHTVSVGHGTWKHVVKVVHFIGNMISVPVSVGGCDFVYKKCYLCISLYYLLQLPAQLHRRDRCAPMCGIMGLRFISNIWPHRGSRWDHQNGHNLNVTTDSLVNSIRMTGVAWIIYNITTL